jgi:hypothetical protein
VQLAKISRQLVSHRKGSKLLNQADLDFFRINDREQMSSIKRKACIARNLKNRLVSTTTFFVTVALGACSAFAGSANCVLESLNSLSHPAVDTAVELELGTTSKVLHLLTTPNRKVGGFFQNGDVVPKWLPEWAKEKHPEVADFRQLDWDSLEDHVKLDLIVDVSRSRGQSFHHDRRIHGLVPKKKVTLRFKKATVFLGKTYSKGEHVIDLSGALTDQVEYRSAREVSNVAGVELHFRSGQSSGQVSNDAWTLLEGFGIPRNYQHVHIVAPIPFDELKGAPRLESARLGDFFRRANLAAEMIDIVEEGGKISTHGEADGQIFFAPAGTTTIWGVTTYFEHLARGVDRRPGDSYKMAWVGMRGSDKYDRPGLWGIEVRSVGSKSDTALYRKFLDSLQFAMNMQEYGVKKDRMSKWLELGVRRNESAPAAVEGIWYNKPWEALFKQAPLPVRLKLLWSQKQKKSTFQAFGNEHDEVKMLFFDWSHDPLFFDNPKALKEIVSAQKAAVSEILAGKTKINEVMKTFLRDSGLYKEVLRSVGLNMQMRQ